MTGATQDSSERLPLPEKKQPPSFTAQYTVAEAELLMSGLIPRQMEDKWFIYFNEGWLYFLRSWTGACIYALRLEGSPAGVRVTDSWVNRDPALYQENDDSYDRKLACFLVDALLLKKPAQFPVRKSDSGYLAGVVQHGDVGRAFPEVEHQRPGFWQKWFAVLRSAKS